MHIILCLVIGSFLTLTVHGTQVIRAAIDIGSGGPKLRVAKVDLARSKIVEILHAQHYPVIFQESLTQSEDRILSLEIMQQGLIAIQQAIALAKSYGANEIVLIGASVFRNAVNGEFFANFIHSETSHQVHILDQDSEAKLAFQATLARTNIDAENLIVWDIGGGSTQLICRETEDAYMIDKSIEGSGHFRDWVIEVIQHQNSKECRSPNPLSAGHANLAEAYAYLLSSKVDQVFRSRMLNPSIEVVGVGSVFGRGFSRLMDGKSPVTIEDLTAAVNRLIDKTDADLGGGDFACVEVSNVLLALGLMKGFGVAQIYLLDINNADGALVYPPFWE